MGTGTNPPETWEGQTPPWYEEHAGLLGEQEVYTVGARGTTTSAQVTGGTSLEEAHARCVSVLYEGQTIRALDESLPDVMQRFAVLGPVTIADMSFGKDVRLDCDDLATSYHVNLPLTGHLVSDHRGARVVATPDLAAVYRCRGETVLRRWPAECRQLAVKLDRRAVDDALRHLSGRAEVSAIPFEPSMSLTSGHGRSWARMLHTISSRLITPDSLVLEPMVARPLAESIIHGFLLAAGHPGHEALTDSGRWNRVRSAVVREAVDLIEADPARALTVTDLARQCHVSVRTLQEGFQRQLGRTPMAYLREVRLQRAHEALKSADPALTTVQAVARSWGFAHPGRFSAAYARAYGELPAQTLRAVI